MSYQSTEGRNRQWDLSCMQVVIGDENGKNFTQKTIPFDVPLNKQGLWNSLCVMDDNTVIALTSTNAYSLNTTEVWMIKGLIINDTAPSLKKTPGQQLKNNKSKKVIGHQ